MSISIKSRIFSSIFQPTPVKKHASLHDAVLANKIDMCRELICDKADVNVTNHEGNTALHIAARNGNHAICELLLEARANTDVRNERELTPLQMVKEYEHKLGIYHLFANHSAFFDDDSKNYLSTIFGEEKLVRDLFFVKLPKIGALEVFDKDRFTFCEQVYRNNLKNREFDEEAPQNFDLERVTIAGRQGASENRNSEVKPTWSKTDSSGYFGISASTCQKPIALLNIAEYDHLNPAYGYTVLPFTPLFDPFYQEMAEHFTLLRVRVDSHKALLSALDKMKKMFPTLPCLHWALRGHGDEGGIRLSKAACFSILDTSLMQKIDKRLAIGAVLSLGGCLNALGDANFVKEFSKHALKKIVCGAPAVITDLSFFDQSEGFGLRSFACQALFKGISHKVPLCLLFFQRFDRAEKAYVRETKAYLQGELVAEGFIHSRL